MSYKPILFNTEMVQAIKEGRKTQTRRVAFLNDSLREFHTLNYPDGWWYEGRVFKDFEMFIRNQQSPCCKYKPGDILWVRETWAHPSEAEVRNGADSDMFIYKADSPLLPAAHGRWYPSIHMPKHAARIFLRVKDVKVQRLREISEADCMAEGIREFTKDGKLFKYSTQSGDMPTIPWADMPITPGTAFSKLWDSTIKPADRNDCSWAANPWVWVIEFEPCERPDDFL